MSNQTAFKPSFRPGIGYLPKVRADRPCLCIYGLKPPNFPDFLSRQIPKIDVRFAVKDLILAGISIQGHNRTSIARHNLANFLDNDPEEFTWLDSRARSFCDFPSDLLMGNALLQQGQGLLLPLVGSVGPRQISAAFIAKLRAGRVLMSTTWARKFEPIPASIAD